MFLRIRRVPVCLAFLMLIAGSASAEVQSDRAAEVDEFFSQSAVEVTIDWATDAEEDFGFHVADGVALYVDFTKVSLAGPVKLHPDTFIGGAVLASDPEANDPVGIYAWQVSEVVTNETKYRELCAFEHRVGGPNVAGTISVTQADGQTLEVGAEVGTSMIGFEQHAEANSRGGRLVISWPNKYCRGVKIQWDSCRPYRCGMTLGDMMDLAGQAGLTIPTSVIAAGVDAVAGWLGAKGYAVNGRCGEVELLWLVPLGCQCVYVQF
ncbi:MAG: hypothetical protein AAF560_05490 [Acidobacteriota bacterium]